MQQHLVCASVLLKGLWGEEELGCVEFAQTETHLRNGANGPFGYGARRVHNAVLPICHSPSKGSKLLHGGFFSFLRQTHFPVGTINSMLS